MYFRKFATIRYSHPMKHLLLILGVLAARIANSYRFTNEKMTKEKSVLLLSPTKNNSWLKPINKEWQ